MTNLPVSGFFRVTCEFGRKNTNKLKWAAGFHTGIDIVSDNRKVYSTCNGNVFQCGYDNAYGNFIVIRDFKTDNFHWFCHFLFRKWDIEQFYQPVSAKRCIDYCHKDEKPYCQQNKNLPFGLRFRLLQTVNCYALRK